jgi:hypothetical protein
MPDTPLSPFGALRARSWNPYAVGVAIGVLSWITFYTMDKALGTSSSFVHVAGAAVATVAPGAVAGPDANAYFAKEISARTPLLDWQMILVIGVFFGAWISSRLSGDRVTESVPGLWAWRFGPSTALRYGAAFVAGGLMLFGARLAGGCTSGHAISGGLQLAVSSWTFFVAMFGAGIATAFTLFGARGRDHVVDG